MQTPILISYKFSIGFYDWNIEFLCTFSNLPNLRETELVTSPSIAKSTN